MNFSAAWQSRLPTRSHVYSTPATWRVWRSAGSFQLLCHSEQPGDGIPVSCSTGVLQGPIQQWREFRASYAGGKIDVEFAAGDSQLFYYISQVRRGAKNHAGAKAEAVLDLVLDPRRESPHVAFFGL